MRPRLAVVAALPGALDRAAVVAEAAHVALRPVGRRARAAAPVLERDVVDAGDAARVEVVLDDPLACGSRGRSRLPCAGRPGPPSPSAGPGSRRPPATRPSSSRAHRRRRPASPPRPSTRPRAARAPACPSSVSLRRLRGLQPGGLGSSRSAPTASSSACSSRSRAWSVALAAMSAVQRLLARGELLERALEPRDLLARRAQHGARRRAGGAARRGGGAGAPRPRGAARGTARSRRAGGGSRRRRQRVDVVADALDEVAVVADDDERARPAVEQVLERASACRCRGRWSARRAAARSARPSAAASAAAGGARRRTGRGRACAPCRRGSRSGRTAAPAVSSRPSLSVARPRTASSASSTRRSPGISAVSCESRAGRTVAPRSTVAAVGRELAGEHRISVVLPEPLTPTSATRWPGPRRQVDVAQHGAPS